MPFPSVVPAPRPVRLLSRPQLVGRIFSLRSALEIVWSQVEADGAECFTSIGPMKRELMALEADLRVRDRISEAVQQASA